MPATTILFETATVGAATAIVQATVASVAPPAFDARTTTECAPTPRPLHDAGDVHAANGPPSSEQVVPATIPVVVHEIAAVATVTVPAGAPVIVRPGGAGTTVHAAVAMALPPAFTATTATVCAPSASAE